MASPNPTPSLPLPSPDPAPAKQPWWQRHQPAVPWLALAVALYVGVSNSYNRNADKSAKNADEHVNTLIGNRIGDLMDNKLTPELVQANAHADAKFTELGNKIDGMSGKIGDLSERVSRIEGSLSARISSLEGHATRQTSLATLMNPNRTLAMIREEIGLAEERNKTLTDAQLVDYKNAVQELPTSGYQYWTTVAAVINYQSHLLQMSGEAPDPRKVSRACGGLTQGTGEKNGFFGIVLSDCVVDLDTTHDTFDHVIFRNSVIRYSGGKIDLHNVRFENCNFQLNLSQKTTPAKQEFLTALLDSPKQTSVKVN